MREDPRLDGGATEEDSSSGSLDLLRRFKLPRPRFAAELLGLRGELCEWISFAHSLVTMGRRKTRTSLRKCG